jgi:tetratricopeptide (TPR) repeat protein
MESLAAGALVAVIGWLREHPQKLKAFGAGMLVGLLCFGLVPLGVSVSTAFIVGTVVGMAVGGAVSYHQERVKVKEEGTASLHYSLIGDRFKEGLAYLDRGQYQRAIAFFNRTIESEPKSADAYFGRGLVYHQMEQYQQAIADFDRAIEIDPEHPYAHFQRGFVYHQLEQCEQAVADFTRAIEIRPDEWAYMLRAAAYNYLGQAELAQADYDRAARISPRPTHE